MAKILVNEDKNEKRVLYQLIHHTNEYELPIQFDWDKKKLEEIAAYLNRNDLMLATWPGEEGKYAREYYAVIEVDYRDLNDTLGKEARSFKYSG